MFTTSETVGLAEWIIDDTCLVFSKITMNLKQIALFYLLIFFFSLDSIWTEIRIFCYI